MKGFRDDSRAAGVSGYSGPNGKAAARFRDQLPPIWEKHGIHAIGFWTTIIGESSNQLTYIFQWESLTDLETRWTAFLNDPAWHKVRDEGERDGPIVASISNQILTPTAFSAINRPALPCFLKACVHDRSSVMTRATSPFHAGEQTIQSLAGVRDRMKLRGRAAIRDYMPEQHRKFFAALPFMAVGLADQNGHPWATTLSGPPGFVNSADENLLTIKAWLDPGDPLHSCIRDGAPIGGLGIEFSTRRRNRINGRIEDCIIGEGFSIGVQQSFGNCPKYIQARNEQPRLRPKPAPKSRMASHLGDSEVSFIAEADTFFIASRSAQLDQEESSQGLDVSHRGGLPGFVRVVSRTELCFPDFRGNLLFNTLGNLEADARAGLLFIDFRSGGMLHVIGRTRICWDVPEPVLSAGIERLIFLDIQCVVNRDHAFPHVFDFVSYSPHLGAEG